ncbi:MAG: hypothetical protein ACJ76L_08160 [Conexibacter sp.]
MEVSMIQLFQLLGAVLILIPFAWSQLGALSVSSAPYLGLNLAGSAVLAAVALADSQWGFLLLEACWALVAGWQLLRPRAEA